ncbi:MAG: YidC/Oxa1 family membrane protein insertase [Schaedlerella sp.]|nr:YidC/Oxa1 family membrane protein insertase [Schaedlerella sp.]
MYGILAYGYGDWPIIHQIAWLMGQLMNGIYIFLDKIFNVQNIGVCIILFTIIIYMLMMPLTLKQQKWSKMSSAMSPELQKIQKKYAGKKDNESMLKQQEEMSILYEKYGTSPTAGCLPMLIQMPILFALYPVIRDIPNYVTSVKNIYMPLIEKLTATDGFQKVVEKIGEASPILMNPDKYDYTQHETLLTVLYNFQESTWATLTEKLPELTDIIQTTTAQLSEVSMFMGINIVEAPWTMVKSSFSAGDYAGVIIAAIIPVLSGLTQFISVKLQPQPNTAAGANDPMVNSMKTMTYTMPLFSVWIGFTLPAGLGLYWAVSAIVRCFQMLGINKYLSTKTTEELIEENRKKAAKKREKKGTSAAALNKMATTNTKKAAAKSSMTEAERNAKLEKAASMTKNAKAGSLASKANMVSRYNNSQSTDKK